MTQPIPITKIIVPEGRRTLRGLADLARSIAEVGLLNPITLTEEYRLIAGYHRLEACKSLDWTEIPATLLTLDELGVALAEIDENLIRNELTVLERGEHLKRRKELYEVIHPETKQHTAGGHAKAAKSATEIISVAQSFADDTAARTGVTDRTIRQEIQIASKLTDEAKETIRKIHMANNKVDLLRLARMTPDEQTKIALRAFPVNIKYNIHDEKTTHKHLQT